MTKLYLTSTQSTSVKAPFGAVWNSTGNADYRGMSLSSGDSLIGKSFTANKGTVFNYALLNRQYVSPEIKATVVFSGTIGAQIEGLIGNPSGNTVPAFYVKLITASGANKKLLGYFGPSDSGTGYVPFVRTNAPIVLSCNPATGVSGDRIAIEVGVVSYTPNFTNISGEQFFGTTPSAELPTGLTTGVAGHPWVKFSDNISF